MPVILETAASTGQLIMVTLIGFATIVALITKFKLHPFLSLTIGSLVVGAIAKLSLSEILASYSKGVGSTVASVGVLIALGAIIGKLLADSGGADEIVDTLVSRASPATLPWAMALIGAVIGLPMFFEIGLVLLVPVILLVTRRSKLSLMRVAIPALAGLSTMHALFHLIRAHWPPLGCSKQTSASPSGSVSLLPYRRLLLLDRCSRDSQLGGCPLMRLTSSLILTRTAVAVLPLVAQGSPSP